MLLREFIATKRQVEALEPMRESRVSILLTPDRIMTRWMKYSLIFLEVHKAGVYSQPPLLRAR